MMNLFSEIIGVRPILVDGKITLYGMPSEPNQSVSESQGLTLLKASGVPLSDLAMKTYSLGPYTEDNNDSNRD